MSKMQSSGLKDLLFHARIEAAHGFVDNFQHPSSSTTAFRDLFLSSNQGLIHLRESMENVYAKLVLFLTRFIAFELHLRNQPFEGCLDVQLC